MPRPISYAVFCLKKKKNRQTIRTITQNFIYSPSTNRSSYYPHAVNAILVLSPICYFFFFNDTATTEIYTLSLHDALPISSNSTKHKSPHLSGWRQIISLIT